MFRNIFLVSIGAIFLILDQTIKFFVIYSLKPNETVPLIKNIFHITLVLNTGCAFGLLREQPTLLFLAIPFAAIIILIHFLNRLRQKDTFPKLAAILLISGSLSNLTDRFRFGYVIDFLDFRIWPVFNLGDTAITIGVLIFFLQLFSRSRVK